MSILSEIEETISSGKLLTEQQLSYISNNPTIRSKIKLNAKHVKQLSSFQSKSKKRGGRKPTAKRVTAVATNSTKKKVTYKKKPVAVAVKKPIVIPIKKPVKPIIVIKPPIKKPVIKLPIKKIVK